MPNHYTNMIVVTHQDDGTHEERKAWLARLAEFAADPFEAALPQSDAAKLSAANAEPGLDPLWYREALANWGTKWGGYDALPPIELPGDGGPVLLVFCTAWGPGHTEARNAIEQYARTALMCRSFAWVGFDPSNDTTQAVHGVTS